MANAEELNQIICASEFVVARCGYSTIMDLIKLQKRALLIPTPGQPEQEYLAQRLSCHPLFTISEEKNLDISKMIRRQ
jgi:predicted glycosyltransferase